MIGLKRLDPRYEGLMRELATSLDQMFNGTGPTKETGFMLIVADLGKTPGEANTVLMNITSESARSMLTEILSQMNGNPGNVDVKGTA